MRYVLAPDWEVAPVICADPAHGNEGGGEEPCSSLRPACRSIFHSFLLALALVLGKTRAGTLEEP